MMSDYIRRTDAMEYLYRALNADPDGNCHDCIHDEHDCQYDRSWTLMDFCEKIEYLGYVPAADVAPVRHGRWIDNKVAFYLGCSECGCYLEYAVDTFLDNDDHYHYCPNCGAKMDGDGNG